MGSFLQAHAQLFLALLSDAIVVLGQAALGFVAGDDAVEQLFFERVTFRCPSSVDAALRVAD